MAANLPNLRLVDVARAAEVLLLAVVVILHAAGWFSLDYLKPLGTLGSLLAEALPFASLTLFALWIPLGPGPLWLRGAASPLLAWLIYQAASSHGPTEWTSADKLLASVAGGLCVSAVALRLCGVRMLPVSPRLDAKAPQFSVRGLLIVTTVVALCVGGLEAARPWLAPTENRRLLSAAELDAIFDGRPAFPLAPSLMEQLASLEKWATDDGRLRHTLMAAFLIVTSLLTAWTVLRPGTIWLRALGVALCVPAAGFYLGQLTTLDAESTLTMTTWVATIGLIVGISVVPIRLMGLRAVRERAIAAAKVPAAFERLPQFSSDRDHLATNHAIRAPAQVQQ